MIKEFKYKFYRNTTDAALAMLTDIKNAKQSIYWEIYSFIDDDFSHDFVEALCERAQFGVEVKIIVDAIGSFELKSSAVAKMRASGVDLLYYNNLSPKIYLRLWLKNLWYRNHRKVLIIDEEIVFIGGVNVAKAYSTWEDIHVRIIGRPVGILLRAFAHSYILSGGKRKNVSHLLKHRLKENWREFKRHCYFILHSPSVRHEQSAKKIFFNNLARCKKTFNLMTPYFVADKKFFTLMRAAKDRGVEVNIFLPERPDHPLLEWIAGFYYYLAHKNGANIFLSSRMNHGKAMTCDDQMGFIGSFNFTPRSFFYNEESGIFFHDEEMVRELNLIFADCKRNYKKLSKDNYLKFDWWSRTKAWLGKHMGEWI